MQVFADDSWLLVYSAIDYHYKYYRLPCSSAGKGTPCNTNTTLRIANYSLISVHHINAPPTSTLPTMQVGYVQAKLQLCALTVQPTQQKNNLLQPQYIQQSGQSRRQILIGKDRHDVSQMYCTGQLNAIYTREIKYITQLASSIGGFSCTGLQ